MDRDRPSVVSHVIYQKRKSVHVKRTLCLVICSRLYLGYASLGRGGEKNFVMLYKNEVNIAGDCMSLVSGRQRRFYEDISQYDRKESDK